MGRVFTLLFSVLSYCLFLLVFVYLIAFLGNLQNTALADAFPVIGTLVVYSIDSGRAVASFGTALAINLGLIGLFGVQHSVMARPGFKRAWTRVVPQSLERSIYVLLSSAVLVFVMWQWRPIPANLGGKCRLERGDRLVRNGSRTSDTAVVDIPDRPL